MNREMTSKELNDDFFKNVLPVTIFIGAEAVVGFLGNILILYVYSKWYVKCNFRYFVLFLSLYDLTSCLTTLPGEIYSQCHWYEYNYDWLCKVKSYFNVFTAWGSAYTLLLLAFDRYRKICRPLAWQIQSSFALKLCVCGVILASFVSIPITILWGKQTYTVPELNITVSICEKSGDYEDESTPFIYVACVYILPLGIMVSAIGVWNVLIARQLFCRMHQNDLPRSYGTSIGRTTMTRNTSTETSLSNLSTVSIGLRRTVSFTASVNSTDRHCRSELGVYSAEHISSVSLSAVSLQTEHIRRRHSSAGLCSRVTADQGTMYNRGSVSVSPSRGTREGETRTEPRHLRWKRKTLIMIILTSVFIVTMTLYIVLLSFVAEKDNILREISNSEKVAFFFFWRLYFVNCVINPILYGVMDPRFRNGVKRLVCLSKRMVN